MCASTTSSACCPIGSDVTPPPTERLHPHAARKVPMRRVERWIFAPEDARRLAAMRTGLCLVLAFRLAANDYDADAARHIHFLPHFYMDVFSRMPSPDLASALQA